MCQAFSCIVDRGAKVTWKLGVDSHESLLATTSYKDNTADPNLMAFARVEITPNNGNYLEPDKWTLKVDQSITPTWFAEKHKAAAHAAHKMWLTKLNKILVRKKIVHPFEIKPPTEITKKHINMLRKWASVRAYTGSFFILPKWRYVKHPRGKYPFTSCIQLWNLGLVPSFDGTTWRLHGGPKAKVLFEITTKELRK